MLQRLVSGRCRFPCSVFNLQLRYSNFRDQAQQPHPGSQITIGIITLLVSRAFALGGNGITGVLIGHIIWVNLGWGVLNLFPVLPLDGGHIATAIAEAAFGRKGRTVALVLSLLITGICALWMMWVGQIWMTIIMVILSVSNFQALGLFRNKVPEQSEAQAPTGDDAERAYSMARSMAAGGDHGEALKWLETAIYAGFNDAGRLDYDEVWEPLRNHARYQSLRRSI